MLKIYEIQNTTTGKSRYEVCVCVCVYVYCVEHCIEPIIKGGGGGAGDGQSRVEKMCCPRCRYAQDGSDQQSHRRPAQQSSDSVLQ